MRMKKEILKKIWGSYPKAATALDITKGALHQWNQDLNSHQIDRVFGAAIRTSAYDPKHFPEKWINEK